jgi:hypothetical protein
MNFFVQRLVFIWCHEIALVRVFQSFTYNRSQLIGLSYVHQLLQIGGFFISQMPFSWLQAISLLKKCTHTTSITYKRMNSFSIEFYCHSDLYHVNQKHMLKVLIKNHASKLLSLKNLFFRHKNHRF